MQSVSSRIWTHLAVSISYDDNHYTTGTSISISTLMNTSGRQMQKESDAWQKVYFNLPNNQTWHQDQYLYNKKEI